MLRSKAVLFAGIILLIIGIIIKKMTLLNVFGLILIITGVFCKTIYIISKARSGEYQPGGELYFLGIGLVLFLSGLYLKNQDVYFLNPSYLIAIGIGLKVIFIVLFIRSVRRSVHNKQLKGKENLAS